MSYAKTPEPVFFPLSNSARHISYCLCPYFPFEDPPPFVFIPWSGCDPITLICSCEPWQDKSWKFLVTGQFRAGPTTIFNQRFSEHSGRSRGLECCSVFNWSADSWEQVGYPATCSYREPEDKANTGRKMEMGGIQGPGDSVWVPPSGAIPMPGPPSLLIANKYSFQFRSVERILNGVLHRCEDKRKSWLI